MEDKKISDISKLLIRGAKMLSYHCPECNVPLFQEEDTIFCPSCHKEAVIEQEGEKEAAKGSAKTKVISSERKIEEGDESLSHGQGTKRKIIQARDNRMDEGKETDVSEMEVSLKNSLIKLSKELENAKDTKEIKEIIEIMDKITSLAERIKNL